MAPSPFTHARPLRSCASPSAARALHEQLAPVILAGVPTGHVITNRARDHQSGAGPAGTARIGNRRTLARHGPTIGGRRACFTGCAESCPLRDDYGAQSRIHGVAYREPKSGGDRSRPWARENARRLKDPGNLPWARRPARAAPPSARPLSASAASQALRVEDEHALAFQAQPTPVREVRQRLVHGFP